MYMSAKVGDEIVIEGHHVGESERKGEVLEVLTDGDVTRFRVQWDDGTEGIFYPGVDAHVVHLGEGKSK